MFDRVHRREDNRKGGHNMAVKILLNELIKKGLAIPAKDILYLCDRKKCEMCHPECAHTNDITHAANFTQEKIFWVERRNDDKTRS